MSLPSCTNTKWLFQVKFWIDDCNWYMSDIFKGLCSHACWWPQVCGWVIAGKLFMSGFRSQSLAYIKCTNKLVHTFENFGEHLANGIRCKVWKIVTAGYISLVFLDYRKYHSLKYGKEWFSDTPKAVYHLEDADRTFQVE